MNRSSVKKYFSENSKAWISESYESDGYSFPTALARTYKAVSILITEFQERNADVLDLGCGAGQLCLRLAEKGHRTTGIDESESMLSEAFKVRALMPEVVQSRVRFVKGNLLDNGFESRAFDAVTALGVIGYLPNDDVLFKEAARLLRPCGVFIVSCRNRLFNMVSISEYTLREIERGGARELVEEIRRLLKEIPDQDAVNFVKSLASISSNLVSETPTSGNQRRNPEPRFTTGIEARQHTPKGLMATAQAHGFDHEGFYGVHPHILMADINRLLPPGVFNRLSCSLEGLDHLAVSLVWSSVFIGVFRKPQ